MFTSKNAANFFRFDRQLRYNTVFSVGGETKIILQKKGFQNILNADENLEQEVRYSAVSDDIGLSANLLDNGVKNFDWGEQLRILIQSNVIFPKKALSRGLNGIVILEVEVYRDGRIGKVIIKKSSGHDILDQSALKGAKRISSLNSRNISNSQEVYYLPIKFN